MLMSVKSVVYRLLNGDDTHDRISEWVDYLISAVICLNVVLIIYESFMPRESYTLTIRIIRAFFFIFFLVEYLLRVWIADEVMKDHAHPVWSRVRYILTLNAIINLLALLPFMLGGTVIDFRIFRVLRLLRITQSKSLKRYTNVLVMVIKIKGAQLLSALFIVIIFMLVSAVIIYDLEHAVQPKVFENVLSGLWWSISAITTIGYGDMYPVTPMGRIFGSCMSFFGVFLMAVPIGILTSGFFEVAKRYDATEKKKDPGHQ